jgi:hypothetical protein
MHKSILRRRKTILIAVFITMLFAIPSVYAAVDWTLPANNLSSGYRVTTENFPNPIMLGEPVIAWAGTTNANIDEVKFRWNPPEDSDMDPFYVVGTAEGYVDVPGVGRVYQWSSTYTPTDPDEEMGDWGIQTLFYDEQNEGNGVGPIPEQVGPIRIIARSFHVIPEVAFGTIAIVIAMFGALGVYAARRKRHPLFIKSM